MIGRQSIKFALGATLFLTGAAFISGCGQDEGQPSRETISAPRGTSPGKTEQVKGKGAGGSAKSEASPKPDTEKKGS